MPSAAHVVLNGYKYITEYTGHGSQLDVRVSLANGQRQLLLDRGDLASRLGGFARISALKVALGSSEG
jgi:hypothetical protein